MTAPFTVTINSEMLKCVGHPTLDDDLLHQHNEHESTVNQLGESKHYFHIV